MKNLRRIAALFLLAALPSAQAASLLFVRNGATITAHETHMINLLQGAGHEVTVVQQGTGAGQIGGTLSNEYQPGQTKSEFLDTFDGVIVPRVSQSANFNDKPGWASLTTGVLVASPFAARGSGGAGMGLYELGQGGGVNFTNLGDPDVIVLDQENPIWAGVNVTDGTTNLWVETTSAGVVNGSLGSVGDGLILGQLQSNNQPFLVAWETGDALGGTETFTAGRRVAFALAGDGTDTTNNTASLTEDGQIAFVNAVDWVVAVADPNAPISFFRTSAPRMLEGTSATLSWRISPNAASATIDQGVGNILGDTDAEGFGEFPVFPDTETTYTLTVTMPDNTTDTRTVTIDVFALASFTANPRISFGANANLQWTVSETFVSVILTNDRDDEEIDVTGDTLNSGVGSLAIFPEKDVTYTLTVTTPNHVESATADVDVRLIARFTASPAFLEPTGGLSTLSWTVRPDATVTISEIGPITVDPTTGTGSTDVTLTGTKTYTLTAEAEGIVETNTITILARPAGTSFALLDIGPPTGSLVEGGIQIGTAANNANGVNLEPTTVTSDTGATFTVAIDNISATGATVGALDWRDRGDSSVPFGALAEDFVKNNGGVVRVTLGGLPAGTYSVVAYTIDPSNAQSSTINIIATDADRTAQDLGLLATSDYPDLIPGTGGLVASDISTRTAVFNIRADGTGDVVLVFDGRGGSDNETPLNGLQLIATDALPATNVRIVSFDYDPATKDATLVFTSTPGETYRIEAGDNLTIWDAVAENLPASGGATTTFVEPNPGAPLDRRFYRIREN